jgi:hypothetical protein
VRKTFLTSADLLLAMPVFAQEAMTVSGGTLRVLDKITAARKISNLAMARPRQSVFGDHDDRVPLPEGNQSWRCLHAFDSRLSNNAAGSGFSRR